ncbi:hypothetical protein TorRG33x02_212820 [Trema orientale]|uniref:Uncharacterized protein n=1 Tax=Trema orientale TaxID=63057 RepID=A0A2P5EBE4_TREOI|nr:hypothetical protein TorRG33x02_212820 [Trema orientale]
MPKQFFRRPFPPQSPTKHIKAVLRWQNRSMKPNEAVILEGSEAEGRVMTGLDKSFGFFENFGNK